MITSFKFKSFSTPLIIYTTLWLCLVVYSFALLDLNLTLYAFPLVREMIAGLQQLGFWNRPLSTLVFSLIVGGLLVSYRWILTQKLSKATVWKWVIGCCLVGVVAYPLFSHDIFNYLFNAKMVLVYHVDPHVQTANQFLNDPWTRFMHNVHTPAPYGYLWTGISLLPMVITLPNFTLSFWGMKGLVIGFFLLELYLIYCVAGMLKEKNHPDRSLWRLVLIAFNPLILMETVIMGHNDSVMMALALMGIYCLMKSDKGQVKMLRMIGWGVYLISIGVKYATVVLAPFLWFRKRLDLFTWGGLALLLVLFTRPGQLHSWYLHWGLGLLVLSRHEWAVRLVPFITMGGLLRYIPYVYYGHWDSPVPMLRWILLLAPLILYGLEKISRNLGISMYRKRIMN